MKSALTIFFRCRDCGVIFESKAGYFLDSLFGKPQICTECRQSVWRTE